MATATITKGKSNTQKISSTPVVQMGNGQSVLRRIEKSKENPDRNKSYNTLVQANTYSQPHTNEESMRANSVFITNCKF